MMELTWHDLQFALMRCPKPLLELMKGPNWAKRIFVGGGFLRSVVAGEDINDIDVFVSTKSDADILAARLQTAQAQPRKPYHTANAITLRGFHSTIQIIHRWVFGSAQAVSDSFDFTCCCAAFWWEPEDKEIGTDARWYSVCDERFYPDVAAKRLIYRNPVRNEDAGGSMLRVLKYYQKGYRIPLDCLADVIARLVAGVKDDIDHTNQHKMAEIICGLLREVDPAIDPRHIAHLPAENSRTKEDANAV